MQTNFQINQFIVEQEKQIEEQLETAIRSFQQLSEQQLLEATHGGWSIAQCLWHLNSYGNFYLPLIQKIISQSGNSATAHKSGWLGNYFTRLMQPHAVKMKAFKNHIPPEQLDAYQEVAIFIHQLETLLTHLRKVTTWHLNQRIPISISPFIRLKLGDVFLFIIAHNKRHVKQALNNIPGS
jgi:hypothetical protein